jgi:hypothetical protein
MLFPPPPPPSLPSPSFAPTDKSLIIKIMTPFFSIIFLKLLVILMNKENVIKIIKENTYKTEVIPTLLATFLTNFFKKFKNLPHDLEKKTTILSNEALLNSLPSFVKMTSTIYNRGWIKALRYNPLSLYRVLSNFDILKPVEEICLKFVSNYIYDEHNEQKKSEDSKVSEGFKATILDETKQLFKIFTVVPINYLLFKKLETCLKVDEEKSTTKHPISEELIVAITCFSFFKILIDIAEKIISSITKEQINTGSCKNKKKAPNNQPLQQPSRSPLLKEIYPSISTSNTTGIHKG